MDGTIRVRYEALAGRSRAQWLGPLEDRPAVLRLDAGWWGAARPRTAHEALVQLGYRLSVEPSAYTGWAPSRPLPDNPVIRYKQAWDRLLLDARWQAALQGPRCPHGGRHTGPV